MKRMLFITLVALIALTMNVSAKGAASPEAKTNAVVETISSTSLNGMVLDKSNNESIAGAIITANGQKVYTDLDGNFTIKNICNGKCQLKISMISYEDQIVDIDTNNANTVQIKLSQR